MLLKIKEEGLGPWGGGRRFSPSNDGKRKKKKVVSGTAGNPNSTLG
jgi:hypothetical protein